MTITSSTSATSGSTFVTSSQPGTNGKTDANAIQDRFLKLLVAQMNNQDPMNPTSNAEMTNQMAQISTVSSISKLDSTMSNMVSQMLSAQILQGASVVGHNVLMTGNTLSVSNGVAAGGVELSASASSVKVDILSPGGQLLDTFDLGAQPAGRHTFTWNAANYPGQSVNIAIQATNGSQAVPAKPMSLTAIDSVSNETGTLQLNLKNGSSVSYSDVAAIY